MAYPVTLLSSLYAWWVFDAEWTRGWIWVFVAIAIAIIIGTWAGAVAGRKGRSTQLWFILGFFLPVIGLVIIYMLKPAKTANDDNKR